MKVAQCRGSRAKTDVHWWLNSAAIDTDVRRQKRKKTQIIWQNKTELLPLHALYAKLLVPWMSGLVTGLQNRAQRFESARHLREERCECLFTTFAASFLVVVDRYYFLSPVEEYSAVSTCGLQRGTPLVKQSVYFLYLILVEPLRQSFACLFAHFVGHVVPHFLQRKHQHSEVVTQSGNRDGIGDGVEG